MNKPYSVRTIILAGSLLVQLGTLCFHAHGAAGDVDLSFDPGSGVNGTVNAVAVQPDGKVIIGGEFTTVKGRARFKLARLNADGSDDSSFNPGTEIYGVYALALQPDGRVLVGHGGGISRLNSNGTPDSSFDSTYYVTGPNGAVLSIVLQPDGKVLIGGWFNTINGTNRNHIARLNANGSLDDSFNPGIGADNVVYSLGLQSDGKVLIGGYFLTVNGTNRNHIARLNGNGSLDLGFNPGNGMDASHIVAQPDGKVLIWGGGFARLNADGSLDNSFHPGIGVSNLLQGVSAVVVQSDGSVLIGGNFDTSSGVTPNNLARLNSNGSLDSSFNPGTGAYGNVLSIVAQPDGKMFIGGDFTAIHGTNRNRVARLNADGGLDSSFNPGTGIDNSVGSVVVQPDGSVLIGGDFTTVKDLGRLGIARLNADGSGDSSFDAGVTLGSVNLMALQPDGKAVIGGGMARLNPNGSREGSFHPDLLFGVTSSPYDTAGATAVTVQPDGKILVGGVSYRYYGCDYEGCAGVIIHYFVARLNVDGSRDTNFNGGGAVGLVSSIAVQSDGKVVVGSDAFVAVTILRLNADGSLDSSFNPGAGPNSGIISVASQRDGKVLVGGYFSAVNGTDRNHIARLNADGSLDNSFNPGTGTDWTVRSVVLQPDGKVLIGGDFATVNGTNRNHIARLNSNGSLDSTFNPGSGTEGTDADTRASVRSIALQTDGTVLIAGDFTTVNGVVRPHVARLYGDSVAPSLNIARSNASLIVSWPLSAAAFVIDQSPTATGAWSQVAFPYTTNATRVSISAPSTTGNRFYRLRKP